MPKARPDMLVPASPQAFFSPLLEPLLLWQSLSLFFLCGLWAVYGSWWAVALAALLFCIDGRLYTKVYISLALVLCMAGFMVAAMALPHRPSLPVWAEKEGRPEAVRMEGQVVRLQSLTDGRLRIFLKGIAPVLTQPESLPLAASPLPGLGIWTWDRARDKAQKEHMEQQKMPFRPLPGQKIQLTAKIRSTEGFANPGQSDFGFYWQSQGVFWRIWTRHSMGDPQIIGKAHFFAQVREHIVQQFTHVLAQAGQGRGAAYGQALAFLPAVLLGEKFTLHQETVNHMQALSLVHSLALSGQHLALVGFVAWLLLQGVSAVWPQIFLSVPRYTLYIVCALPLAVLYLWLGNAPASLMRAVCMLAITFLIFWRQRVVTLRHVLVCALLLISLAWPLALYDMGLQLSIACMASLCIIIPIISHIDRVKDKQGSFSQAQKSLKPRGILSKIGRFFVHSFFISCGIQVMLLPLMLLYFPPSGMYFVANCLWLPVLAFWVLPWGALGLVFSLGPVQEIAVYCVSLAVWPCQALLATAQFLQEHSILYSMAVMRPHGSVLLAWIALMLAMALLVGRVSWQDIWRGEARVPKNIHRLCLVAACLFCVAPVLRSVHDVRQYIQQEVYLQMFDVGHGQAIALHMPGGQRILVDGAGSAFQRFEPGTQLVLPSLVYNEAPRLWSMFASHADVDHLRGLLYIMPHVRPQYFYTNGGKFSKKDYALWQKNFPELQSTAVYAGQKLSLPSLGFGHDKKFYMEVLWPPKGTKFRKNNASLVLRLVQEEKGKIEGLALLCGDAEREALQNMLDLGMDVSAKVLVVPHHGAWDSYFPAFYTAVGAEVALISVARQNNFAHPHAAVYKALQDVGMTVYTTAESGALYVRLQPFVEVKTAHKNALHRDLLF